MTEPRQLTGRPPTGASHPQTPATRSRWWIALAALLPAACCVLPAIFVAAAAAGTGAILGGIGGAVVVAAAVAYAIWAIRRRTRGAACPTPPTSGDADPDRTW